MNITAGKLRGYQQLSNEQDIFTVVAFDHRDVFVETLSQTIGVPEATWAQVVAEKIRICQALAPYASSVMLDPLYSVGPVLTAGVLPGSVGFVAARENDPASPRPDFGETS